jgi:hypothetical protein
MADGPKPKKKPSVISHKRAVLLFQTKGTVLRKMHGPDGMSWYLMTPGGGPVTEETARKLIAQENAVAQGDGLLDGCDQTWTCG